MDLFKPTAHKIMLAIIIFAIFLFFLFPVKQSEFCLAGIGSQCPTTTNFIRITELNSGGVLGINYFFILIELIISYIISAVIIRLFQKKD